MSRIFITGSTDGLGRMAAQLLIDQGHEVILHARNTGRAKEALVDVRGAKAVLVGDLSSMTQTHALADQANRFGHFDALIHNAAVGYREPERRLIPLESFSVIDEAMAPHR